MVKVKLMEKSVNSHVGKVYVTQYRTVGSTLKTERTTRASRPKLAGGGASAVFIPTADVERASAASWAADLETAAPRATIEDMLGDGGTKVTGTVPRRC